ncbi:hypothetical protein EV702DRAFT_1204889 [Suillus placidus]|uniref:Uncharacterized protein n=1 Tax=Suillus placidus TaxID=48579 RepID=A0A9P6ZG43_9AGAM|nr:hypothetical protein EV702DRAFT_1204889 [Suillus placidus]
MPGAGCPTSVPGAGMTKDQPSMSLKGQTETNLLLPLPSRPPPHQNLSLASVGGRVEPGESVYVSVMLQPMKDEPPLSLYLPPEGQTLEEEDEGHAEPLIPPVLPAEHAGGPSNYATLKNTESRPPPLCQNSLSTTQFKLHRLCNPSALPHHLHQNVYSTQLRYTSPELYSSGEETAGEEHFEVAEEWNWVNETVLDDGTEWADKGEDDKDDLLDLEYHPNYVNSNCYLVADICCRSSKRLIARRIRRWSSLHPHILHTARADITLYLFPSTHDIRNSSRGIAACRQASRARGTTLVESGLLPDGSDGSSESRESAEAGILERSGRPSVSCGRCFFFHTAYGQNGTPLQSPELSQGESQSPSRKKRRRDAHESDKR